MFKTYSTSRPFESISLPENLFPLIQVIGASIFIALCAQINIPLFFSPVPLTLQTLSILFVGGMLGPKKGVASVLLYLAEGCCGLPVFAEGKFGLITFFGPTGGYLVGFVLQSYLAGWILEKSSLASSNRLLATLILAGMAQLACGVLWLSQFVGWNNVLLMGFYPFIPGEIIKSLAATTALTAFKRNS